jgi:dienelactone hydrolase
MSNFKGKGPVPVGTTEAISTEGVADLAGNVREWCWNVSERGRCLRGGAWNDQEYMYYDVTQAPPFDRSEKNGLRCARYVDSGAIPPDAFDAYRTETVRDLLAEKPVSNEVFAAYPGERVIAQVFLPRRAKPPFQVVVYFPGAGAVNQPRPSDVLEEGIEFSQNVTFFLQAGRAVLYPVMRGTHERRRAGETWPDAGSRENVAWNVQLVQDVHRSVDYLVSRPDVDSSRLAFCGFSWGGWMGSLVLAGEDRFKTGIIHSGGLAAWRIRSEVDPLNYVSHVRMPVLMLHGRYDLTMPLETEARPMFELLGTPPAQKRLHLVDSDHWIPRPDLIRESLAWLDKHLGPVDAPAARKTP